MYLYFDSGEYRRLSIMHWLVYVVFAVCFVLAVLPFVWLANDMSRASGELAMVQAAGLLGTVALANGVLIVHSARFKKLRQMKMLIDDFVVYINRALALEGAANGTVTLYALNGVQVVISRRSADASSGYNVSITTPDEAADNYVVYRYRIDRGIDPGTPVLVSKMPDIEKLVELLGALVAFDDTTQSAPARVATSAEV